MDSNNRKPITLIGFMGVGKTTIGKVLAKKLNYNFIDTDREIEKRFNMTTTDIFKTYGEAAFRRAECELTLTHLNNQQTVLSLGGGAFLQDEIKHACLNQSTTIFLEISWKAWRRRVKFLKHKRPLLQNKSMKAINLLFNERQKHYQDYHLKVKCDFSSVNKIAKKIIYLLKKDKV